MTTAAHGDDISPSWQGRCPGSVFAAAVIEILTSTSSPLLDDGTEGTEEESLQPEEPTSQQTETYNEFCQSILNICSNGPFEERLNADTHPSSEAFVRVPKLSELAKISGGTFFIDENTGNICQKRVSSMAQLYHQTCPGDENRGWGPMAQGRLRRAIEGRLDAYGLEEAAGMICFRWELGLLADYMVEAFGLPKPGGDICILWESGAWRSKVSKYPLHSMIFGRLVEGGFPPYPTESQGPPFMRFPHYMAAAVALKTLPEPDTNQLIYQLVRFMTKTREFQQQRVVSDCATLERAQRWFQTVGRKMRSS